MLRSIFNTGQVQLRKDKDMQLQSSITPAREEKVSRSGQQAGIIVLAG